MAGAVVQCPFDHGGGRKHSKRCSVGTVQKRFAPNKIVIDSMFWADCKFVYLNVSGDWKGVMQLYENGFYDNSILWFKPSLAVLDFLKRHLSILNIKGVTSVGCGTGLFEWLLHSFTGTFHGRFFGYGSNYIKKRTIWSVIKKTILRRHCSSTEISCINGRRQKYFFIRQKDSPRF